MKRLSHPLAFAIFCASLLLSSCGVVLVGVGNQVVTLNITPAVASIPVNGTEQFTAATGAADTPAWSFQFQPIAGTGTFNTSNGGTVTYTAPKTPPVYDPTALAAGAVQGSVTIMAHIPSGNFGGTSSTETIPIIAPAVTVGIFPTNVSLALGGTVQFFPYAVGNVNNRYTVQVNGVTGGSTANGTLGAANVYTAPTSLPIGGPAITVTVVSQADPTKTASAIVTLH